MVLVCPNCQQTYTSAQRICTHCGSGIHPELQLTDPAAVRSSPRAARPDRPGEDDDDGPDPLVGTTVENRYLVLEAIGQGGMGAVYKVQHTEMGKVMAMKVLHRDLARDKDVVRRFKREAQAISRLTHIHTVSIFDFGRSAAGYMYLVMEYLRGEDLGTILKRDGPICFARAAPILSQICAALGEAHEAGIIHRDLKPENILVARTKEGRDFVKVLDFGLAKLREDAASPDVTGRGSVVGTPYFMSPEQIRAEPLDHRSDIYSLGALAYRMLTGENPFQASSAVGVLTKHLTERLIPPTERRPDLGIPASAEAIVLRAMAKDPAQRYQSVEAMRAEIEQAVAAMSQPPDLDDSHGSYPPPLVTYVGVAGRRSSDRGAGHTPASSGKDGGAQAFPVSTREDWDRYERTLRRRRIFQLSGLPLLVILAGGGLYWAWKHDRLAGLLVSAREQEPNNSPDQANRIASGQVIRGQIGGRLGPDQSDNDWYRIAVTQPGPHALELSVDPIPNMDLRVELYDAEKRLYTADATGVGGREVIPNWRLDGKLYYVRVHETPVLGKAPTENPTDDYVLKATWRPATQSEELEPNDGPEQAMPVRLGARIVGVLGAPNDIDWFRLSWPAGQAGAARIGVTGIAGVDVQLVVAAPSAALPNGPGQTRTDLASVRTEAQDARVINAAGPGEGEKTLLRWQASDASILFAVRRLDRPDQPSPGGGHAVGAGAKPLEVPGLQIPYTLSIDAE